MPELVHGGDIYSLETEKPVLDFSANINPLGMPRDIAQALAGSISCWEHYPDPLCRKLTGALALAEGCPPEQILCGNGAADLIFRLTLAKRPRTAMVLAPTFAEYEQALELVGCQVTHYPLQEKNGFRLEPDFLDYLDEKLDMLFLCNPNNPTGQVIEPELINCIIQACQRKGIFLVIDECFNDFLDEPESYTAKAYLNGNPGLFLLKAFTKLYAMAGVRLGYGLCSDITLLEKMRSCGQPWGVSVPAQTAGIAALGLTGFAEKTRAYVHQERIYLTAGLRELGYQVWDSSANYLFLKTEDHTLHKRLRTEGILIRDCSNYRGLGSGYYRVAVRSREENEMLLQALAALDEEVE